MWKTPGALIALSLLAGHTSIDPSEQIRQWVEGKTYVIHDQKIFCKKTIPEFYLERDFNRAWTSEDNVRALIEQIRLVKDDGLNPDDYHLEYLLANYENIQSVDPWMDIILTDSYLLLTSHLLSGKINPETIDPEWKANRREANLKQLLSTALPETEISKSINSVRPQYKTYTKLRKSLIAFRKIEEDGGWPEVSTGETLHPGDISDRVVSIRKRLSIAGDYTENTDNDSAVFDESLAKAIKIFQKRHGLAADGLIGKATISLLNQPVNERIDQIVINMERCRWLPLDLGKNYILVNIANFELEAVKEGEVKMKMDVVVGKPFRKTPVFSEQLRYLVFNPYWTIPPTILAQDILPAVRKNPHYLTPLNIKVIDGDNTIAPETIDWQAITAKNFPYQLRQEPGINNALGIVKFIFPNPYNVYMHDTNHRELFVNNDRALSSGCIRLSRPKDMIRYVLEDHPDLWTEERVEQTITNSKNQTVFIKSNIWVHLLYWTCYIDEDNLVNFRKDIYERDAALLKALMQDPPAI